MVADGDITSNGGNVAVIDSITTYIKTGVYVSSSGNIYALGQISTSDDVVSA